MLRRLPSATVTGKLIDKHLHHPDVHIAASRWSEEQTLHVAACYSNPFRWRSRRELANDFRRHMAQLPNVELHMIELAYGDRPFEVTAPHLYPNDIQLRTSSELFHKENLINLAVQRFPPTWRYGAAIDADFHFTRHDLALETIHQLQHWDWVQMFSSYTNLSGETEPGKGHLPIGQLSRGFAYGFVSRGYTLPEGYNGGWSEPEGLTTSSGIEPLPGSLEWIGAPGGAWAFRRSAFKSVGGFLDKCILGSSDYFMAFGLAGHTVSADLEERLGRKVNLYRSDYFECIRAWQERAKHALQGNIGYVDCHAIHHFHGPLKKRGYGNRDDILIDNNFSPVHDVHYDDQGVLELTTRKPRLRDAIRSYFISRSEDLPHTF